MYITMHILGEGGGIWPCKISFDLDNISALFGDMFYMNVARIHRRAVCCKILKDDLFGPILTKLFVIFGTYDS